MLAAENSAACHPIMNMSRACFQNKSRLYLRAAQFWVIKGLIQCRNELVALEETKTRDGRKACSILMKPKLIPVVPTPKRPFQGWRYLKAGDAPADLGEIGGANDLPPELRAKLANLGAW